MRHLARLLAAGIALSACVMADPTPPATDLLHRLPLRFEQDASSQWVTRGPGYAFVFRPGTTMLMLGERAVALSLVGSNPDARFEGRQRSGAPTQYFTGKTHRSSPGFLKLHQSAAYPGIDVVYYGNGDHLEYDFQLAPGADPSQIRLHFDGADRVALNEQGEIVLTLGQGEVTQKLPTVYQVLASGEKVDVHASYRMGKDGNIGLDLGSYDPDRELVIDPEVVYNAYIGGTQADAINAIARDAQGRVYLAGYTFSTDFPFGPLSYSIIVDIRDVFAMQLDLTSDPEDVIKYSTIFGGFWYEDMRAMAVDPDGIIYITGTTSSTDLPVVNQYHDTIVTEPVIELPHPYLAVIDPSIDGEGGLLYSTYFGGAGRDEPTAIAVSGTLAYVVGTTLSDDYPVVGGYQSTRVGSHDSFLSIFDRARSGTDSLAYSTYFGGTLQDLVRSVAVDDDGRVYLSGITYSTDFPIAGPGAQSSYSGGGDVFVTQIDPGSNQVLFSTYIGGSSIDEARRVRLAPNDHVVLAGYTLSDDFPVTSGAAQSTYGGGVDAFVTEINVAATDPSALITYSTYFGGSQGDIALDMQRGSDGRYYLGGYTFSYDMPVTPGAFGPSPSNLGLNGFVVGINPAPDASPAVFYSTYISGDGYQLVYGVDVDSEGKIYVGGQTTGTLFGPQPNGLGNFDGFLLVLKP